MLYAYLRRLFIMSNRHSRRKGEEYAIDRKTNDQGRDY